MSEGEILEALTSGDITRIGLHPEGSNYVFLVKLEFDDDRRPLLGIYKPRAGERPLRDFPRGTLYRRECAAYELGAALGWPSIPPTVIRDGPHGIGSVQLYIEADPSDHYFNLRDTELSRLETVAFFDWITNNADRKASSCLKDRTGRIWTIDHGLTFNPYTRQRTVMWEFCGAGVSPALVDDLGQVVKRLSSRDPLGERLRDLLSDDEVDWLGERIQRIHADPVFPVLDPQRNIPWPLL